ncbi:MAG: hypothetical protein JWN98_496 [Abditibacteriota bacterium]|nr:hypothetical protein [Abditibacteriota bacterium]
MLAACLATAMWAIFPRGGVFAWGTVALLGFARVFCGTNYPVDIAAGAVLGWAWGALALGLCRVRLPIPSRDGHILFWRARRQAFWAASAVAVVALLVGIDLSRTPRYALQMQTLWNAPWSLAPVTAAQDAPRRTAAQHGVDTGTSAGGGNSGDAFKPASGVSTHEGEGVSMAPEADVTAPAVRFSKHYGRQAPAEAYLSRVLSALPLAHKIVDLEVAQVRVGNTTYRATVVRFEAQDGRVEERRLVAETAAAVVKATFHADATVQNVDVLAVIKRPSPASTTGASQSPNQAADQHSHASSVQQASREWVWTPVFTASVQRRNLRIIKGPQWANASGVDAGLWLRARSRLYIDSRVLPKASTVKTHPTVAPAAIPTVVPTTAPTPMPATPMPATPMPATPVPATPIPSTPTPVPAQAPRQAPLAPNVPAVKRRVSPPVPSSPRSTQSTLKRSVTSVPRRPLRPAIKKPTIIKRSLRSLRRGKTRAYRSKRRYRTRRLRRRY